MIDARYSGLLEVNPERSEFLLQLALGFEGVVLNIDWVPTNLLKGSQMHHMLIWGGNIAALGAAGRNG